MLNISVLGHINNIINQLSPLLSYQLIKFRKLTEQSILLGFMNFCNILIYLTIYNKYFETVEF